MSTAIPRVLIAAHEHEFAAQAAQEFITLLEMFDTPLVTLPTGMTPLGFYQALINNHAPRRDLWDALRFTALDEYHGLPPGDERLFGAWLTRTCLDPLQINRRHFFDSMNDPVAESVRMDTWLQQNGPLDIAVLGLGSNGHIAFNEPGTGFDTGAHVMTLTPESVQANARYWGGIDRVPRQGITLGLRDLAQARHTLLLVSGAGKADILAQALGGPVTPGLPASYLQTIKNVTIVADRDAASKL